MPRSTGRSGESERSAVLADELLGQHGAHVVQGELLDLANLVRGAEAVEEMHEGNARFEGCGLRDERGVHDLLHVVGGQQRPAGLAHGHDVLMIAEDGQPLGGDRARGYMDDAGRELAGDLVHVGNHQQQTLRRGEGGRQAAALQSSVHCRHGAAFALHFHHVGNVPQMLGWPSEDHWSLNSPMGDDGVMG